MKASQLLLAIGAAVTLFFTGRANVDEGLCLIRGYSIIAEVCYKFSQAEKSWEDAENDCSRDRGSLVSMITREQYDGLIGYMQNRTHDRYWVSGAARSGSWIWTGAGTPMPRSFWGDRVIPPATNGSCATVCSNTTRFWAANCTEQKNFICQMDVFYFPHVEPEQEDDGITIPPVDPEQ